MLASVRLSRSLFVPATLSFLALAASASAAPDPRLFAAAHAQAAAALEQNPALTADPFALIVKFRKSADAASVAAALQQVGGQSLREFSLVPGLQKISTTLPVERSIAVLAARADVEYAEPDYVVHKCATPNDTYFNLMWGLNNTGQTVNGDPGTAGADINAPEAWNVTTGDANFVIADIDTGMQLNHPDLAANLWTNPGEIAGNGIDDDGNGYVDDVHGWDFYSVDTDPSDSDGHGTHTAGTVWPQDDTDTASAPQTRPATRLGPHGRT